MGQGVMDADEAARLAEIKRYETYGALAGPRLWQVVHLAQTIFDVEEVSLSTVYADRQICHVKVGSLTGTLPRCDTFCQTTIQHDAVVVSPDALQDHRFNTLPIVTGAPHLRFYAGAPLITPSGMRIGSLCLLGFKARQFTARETKLLGDLAALAIEHMELICANQAAKMDSLTGLHNREFLIEAMNASIAADRRSAAILIDLDGFKTINDSLGHSYGDETLKIVASKLRLLAGEGPVVARLGGDEFVVFLDGCPDPAIAAALAERIVSDIGQPTAINDHLVTFGASVGLAVRVDEPDALKLLGQADLAMYEAKKDGRGCVRVFERSMRGEALERSNVILELQEAWNDGALELYYQPIVRLEDGVWIGAEALLRWNYVYRGVLPPALFLPVLEQSSLAIDVGSWIIRDACRQVAEWRKSRHPDFQIAVNLFEVQFKTGDLVAVVMDALDSHGLPPNALSLEITENVMLGNDRRIIDQLRTLRERGVGIAFDDFGTGFASLAALKDCPVTCLKIDRSFISLVATSSTDLAIVDALLHLAKAFNLSVVAEGIETEAQFDMLRTRLCGRAQGYLFSKPVTADMFARNWPGEGRERPVVAA